MLNVMLIFLTDYSIEMFSKVIFLLEYLDIFCDLMHSGAYYAKNYASIIGLGLPAWVCNKYSPIKIVKIVSQ